MVGIDGFSNHFERPIEGRSQSFSQVSAALLNDHYDIFWLMVTGTYTAPISGHTVFENPLPKVHFPSRKPLYIFKGFLGGVAQRTGAMDFHTVVGRGIFLVRLPPIVLTVVAKANKTLRLVSHSSAPQLLFSSIEIIALYLHSVNIY